MVVLGEIVHSHGRRLLELGCGHGRLLQLLTLIEFDKYLGLDVSEEALNQARALDIDKASFVCANFDEWQSPDLFDVIVFNESLYYARRPQETIRRYRDMLTDGGSLIVSMYRYGNTQGIWSRIRREFELVDLISVEHNRLRPCDIALLRR